MKFWGYVLLVVLILTGVAVPAAMVSAQASPDAVNIYYVGPQDEIYAAIQRAAPYVLLVDNPELAQVFVLNDPVLEYAQLQSIGRLVLREEVGLVLFLGPHFPTDANDIRALLGVGAFGLSAAKNNLQSLRNSTEPDPLQAAIAWNSAPELRARSVVSNPNLLQPVVITAAGEPVVQRGRGREQVQIFVVGAWLADVSNAVWAEWPYFDYFLYRLLAEAAGAPRLLAFADYPRAPVPQGRIRGAMGGLAVLDLLIFLVALFIARRSLFLHPQRWMKARLTSSAHPSEWQAVGFHRPLAALLFLLGIGPLMLLPWLSFQLQLLPNLLLPWTQTQGFWEQTGQWLTCLWILLDAGLGTAAVWYFAAWRAREPREGLRYMQLYIWWQILSGAVQLFLTFAWVIFIMPRTPWAHLAFYLVARTLLQFPGFLLIFRYFFRAEQRFDYEQRLVVLAALGGMALQFFFVVLFRQVFPNLFDLDVTIRSVLGLGAGLYFAEWLAFGFGVFLYRHLGYTLYPLFVPAFDWGVLKRALRYGMPWAAGTLAVAIGTLLQSLWLPRWLPEFGSGQLWGAAFLFVLVFEALQLGLYDSLMPALVEALHQEARTLVRYILGQALRYGLWAALPLLVALILINERLEAGWLGGAYVGLTPFLGPILAWTALQGPAWAAERLLEAEGHPGLRSVALAVEQGLRLALLAWLAPRLGVSGLWIAFLSPLVVRTVFGWGCIRRWRVKFNLWQAFVVPASAAFLVYHGLRLLLLVTASSEVIFTQLAWFFSLLLLLPIYGFVTGLLGGWDDRGVEELRLAVRLSDLGLPLAGLLWGAVRLGARLSPLHALFPMALQSAAWEEAQAISMRRLPRA
ncbi:MAG: hypothetical protein JW892_15195 [Anaerolineae bacterium]|nr:hypothetical protein [Anaerolineae bacterium]